MGDQQLHQLPLSRTVRDPRVAREFVAERLLGIDAHRLDDILLLVSELVTNVVYHGGGPAHLELRNAGSAGGDGAVRVDVYDGGPLFAYVRVDPTTASRHGRGLFFVAAVATGWGITPHESGNGKIVWFEL